MNHDPLTLFMETTNATVIERVDVPARPERRRAPPEEFLSGAVARWLTATTGAGGVWLNQAAALSLVAAGKNVVTSTGTASGKTLIFQAAIIRELSGRGGRALLLYPQKSLVADQERRMRDAARLAGFDEA